MGRNHLAHAARDAANAVLAAAGYNFRRLLAWLAILLRAWLLALIATANRPSIKAPSHNRRSSRTTFSRIRAKRISPKPTPLGFSTSGSAQSNAPPRCAIKARRSLSPPSLTDEATQRGHWSNAARAPHSAASNVRSSMKFMPSKDRMRPSRKRQVSHVLWCITCCAGTIV